MALWRRSCLSPCTGRYEMTFTPLSVQPQASLQETLKNSSCHVGQ